MAFSTGPATRKSQSKTCFEPIASLIPPQNTTARPHTRTTYPYHTAGSVSPKGPFPGGLCFDWIILGLLIVGSSVVSVFSVLVLCSFGGGRFGGVLLYLPLYGSRKPVGSSAVCASFVLSEKRVPGKPVGGVGLCRNPLKLLLLYIRGVALSRAPPKLQQA